MLSESQSYETACLTADSIIDTFDLHMTDGARESIIAQLMDFADKVTESDLEMTPEQFDAHFVAGQPVEIEVRLCRTARCLSRASLESHIATTTGTEYNHIHDKEEQ